MNSKAQLKIQQTAFMLIAVTLFFVLVFLLVIIIQFSGLKDSAEIAEEQQALLLVSRLSGSPEFSCNEAYGNIVRANCVDLDKVEALKSSEMYDESFWEVEAIEIMKIYPEHETINVFGSSNEGIGVSNFVSLCGRALDEGQDYKCELGKLIVTYKT